MSATRAPTRRSDLTAELLAPLAGVLTALLALVALLLAVRRLRLALDPLEPWVLLVAGAAFVLFAASIRTLDARTASAPVRRRHGLSTTLSLLAIGLCLCAGANVEESLGCWAMIAVEESWGWGLTGRSRRGIPGSPSRAAVHEPLVPATEIELESAATVPLTQRFSRSLSAAGEDRLEGWVLGTLAAGQRHAYVHVAFCPPFARTPEVEFEQVDGPAARVQIGKLYAYGMRLDVKLDEIGPAEVPIEFVAVCRESSQRSAFSDQPEA